MNDTLNDPRVLEQIEKLKAKYDAMGQDMHAYLEGLLYANGLSYWEYIHLDTLLSLQNPRTDIPDEQIFIMYHQITELYFKLIIHEMKQLSADQMLTLPTLLMRLRRMNRYFTHLADSFEIMAEGMDKEQFLRFRMSLLPASGFQSVQYRMIEMRATDFAQLLSAKTREQFADSQSIEEMFPHLYWKSGATELATGKKTLTLRRFEEKYYDKLVRLAYKMQQRNIRALYRQLCNQQPEAATHAELTEALRRFDYLSNVQWPLSHFKSAVRYLQNDPDVISATGGTNWQKYLPPRFQRVMFFPELWTAEEKERWGSIF